VRQSPADKDVNTEAEEGKALEAGEDTAQDLIRAAVNCRLCELAIAL
jgi:hypothetical protein